LIEFVNHTQTAEAALAEYYMYLITGSSARSEKCRTAGRPYLFYSGGDFEVFQPHCIAPMEVKCGMEVHSYMPDFTPISAGMGYGTQKDFFKNQIVRCLQNLQSL